MQLMLSKKKRIPFPDSENGVEIQIEILCKKLECFCIAHQLRFRIFVKKKSDAGCMVRFHVGNNQIVRKPVTQGLFKV